MANYIANNFLLFLLDPIDGLTTIEVILCGPTFDGTDEDDFVDDITTLAEINATNYGSGWGNRSTLDNVAATVDDANNRADLDADDEAFGALGGATNSEIEHILLAIKGSSDDTDAKVIGDTDLTGSTLTTNGSTVTVTIADFFRLGRAPGS